MPEMPSITWMGYYWAVMAHLFDHDDPIKAVDPTPTLDQNLHAVRTEGKIEAFFEKKAVLLPLFGTNWRELHNASATSNKFMWYGSRFRVYLFTIEVVHAAMKRQPKLHVPNGLDDSDSVSKYHFDDATIGAILALRAFTGNTSSVDTLSRYASQHFPGYVVAIDMLDESTIQRLNYGINTYVKRFNPKCAERFTPEFIEFARDQALGPLLDLRRAVEEALPGSFD